MASAVFSGPESDSQAPIIRTWAGADSRGDLDRAMRCQSNRRRRCCRRRPRIVVPRRTTALSLFLPRARVFSWRGRGLPSLRTVCHSNERTRSVSSAPIIECWPAPIREEIRIAPRNANRIDRGDVRTRSANHRVPAGDSAVLRLAEREHHTLLVACKKAIGARASHWHRRIGTLPGPSKP